MPARTIAHRAPPRPSGVTRPADWISVGSLSWKKVLMPVSNIRGRRVAFLLPKKPSQGRLAGADGRFLLRLVPRRPVRARAVDTEENREPPPPIQRRVPLSRTPSAISRFTSSATFCAASFTCPSYTCHIEQGQAWVIATDALEGFTGSTLRGLAPSLGQKARCRWERGGIIMLRCGANSPASGFWAVVQLQ